MREIKFRSWIKNKEKFIYDFFLTQPRFSQSENSILTQYTGLKDKKNGVEIYEGDVVQGSRRSHEEIDPIKQRVHFHNGCYMFGNWNAHEYFNKHQHIEVVGNIYQNPDLLLETEDK